MAIYHLSAKPVQRSKGHSATAGGAYRAGDYIKDDRTGEIHDYRKKNGILYSEIITPLNEKIERADLWNIAEKAEKRKDGTTAREYEISLPSELNEEQRKELALEFTKYIVEKNKCVADVSLHEPNRKGDERNFHAHILCTTRVFENGQLTKKCDIELSDTDRAKKGLDGRKSELEKIRKVWEQMANTALEKSNSKERIDARSLEAQGIERKPQQHMGKNATAIERKGIKPRRTRIKISEQNAPNKTVASIKYEDKKDLEFSKENWLSNISKTQKWIHEDKEIERLNKYTLNNTDDLLRDSIWKVNSAKDKLENFERDVSRMSTLKKLIKASSINQEREELERAIEEKIIQKNEVREKISIDNSARYKLREISISRDEYWKESIEYQEFKARSNLRSNEINEIRKLEKDMKNKRTQEQGLSM